MKYHFISIGGAIMHNLALALKKQGHQVSGSDDEIFDPSYTRLSNGGLLPKEFGWFEENVDKSLDAIILGMHAKADNPELIKAQQLGIRIYSFPEFVYQHAKNKKRIVVAGSHGKTSTTAMILYVLKNLNYAFDYLVGSQIDGFDLMVGLSDAPIMVIEGDEYLTSPLDRVPKFLWYKPQVAIITGIAWDHINVFPTFENYVSQFQLFIDTLPKEAQLITYDGDEELNNLQYSQALLHSKYQGYKQKITQSQVEIETPHGSFGMEVFGQHNFENMEAAVLALEAIGISPDQSLKTLSTFTGTANRLETIYNTNSIRIFKDFAHSPSKVKATVNAVCQTFKASKVVALMELHTYSSLNPEFIPLYHNTLKKADVKAVFYDTHVFELKGLEILSKEEVSAAFGDDVLVFTDTQEVIAYFKEHFQQETVYLLMSSGSFGKINWHELIETIK